MHRGGSPARWLATAPRHRSAWNPRPCGPAGQAAPDPYRAGPTPHRGTHMPDRGWTAPRCRGEALPRPPAPEARRFRVADTSRSTRTADQLSARLHDRPAVNGRAQSPSRLKPADPHGACTRPIDPGAWAPSQPPSGGLRTEPGASAPGVRCPPPPPWSSPHRDTRRHALPALAGRTGQAAPDPYMAGVVPSRRTPMSDRGRIAPPCRGEALPRPPAPSSTLVAGGTARWAAHWPT
jgi:hypothetical protein